MKNLLITFILCGAGTGLSAQTILQQFAAISAGSGTVSDMDLPNPTAEGSVIIASPMQLSPDVKLESITDNAPGGGNTYKPVPGAMSFCAKKALEIWYCENCKGGVTELKFHLTGHVRASINGFMEVSGLAVPAKLDGNGVSLNDGVATSAGSFVGPNLKTSAKDFVIARYFVDPPIPTGVTPAAWTYKSTYVYGLNLAPGSYQPTLTGGKANGSFCMSMAAFKVADSAPAAKAN
ncbi:MAG TPA: hypothetical protein VL983_07825 [Terriglobales bacterium]|nr:hypothetical protein [Terriglobales bacterium]